MNFGGCWNSDFRIFRKNISIHGGKLRLIFLGLRIFVEVQYDIFEILSLKNIKVRLENGWNSKRMITEGEAAIPLETTRRAFGNQEKSKQRSAIVQKLTIYIHWL